jgi:hypothetical protein
VCSTPAIRGTCFFLKKNIKKENDRFPHQKKGLQKRIPILSCSAPEMREEKKP